MIWIFMQISIRPANGIKVTSQPPPPYTHTKETSFLARREFRRTRSRTVTLELESTMRPVCLVRQRSHYANSINSSAVSDTRGSRISMLSAVSGIRYPALHGAYARVFTRGPASSRHITDNTPTVFGRLHNFAPHASQGAMK